MNRLADRIEKAILELDLGIPMSRFKVDFIGAVNSALRHIGAPALESLEDTTVLLRTALFLESRV